MTRTQDLVGQLQTILDQLKAEVSPPTPSTTVSTTADLVKALAAGGPIALAPGSYTGNFTITKPTTLDLFGATLIPLDQLSPALIVRANDVIVSSGTIQNGAPDRDTVIVGDFNATSADAQPNRITFDGVKVQAGALGGHRAFALHGANITVKNGRVTGFWEKGRDSQAIWVHNGPGPYTITDNYLEASGETILVGGDTFHIPNVVPSEITIARNVCYKPDAWRAINPVVKNCIELKAGVRVLIEDNVCDGNWKSGQDGNPIVLTVRNQNNDSPWVRLDQVIVRGNVTRRCMEGYAVGILGFDNNYPSQQTQMILIEHNLFTDSPNGFKVGNGVAMDLTIRQNTLPAIVTNLLQFYDERAVPVKSPLTFAGNVAKGGAYGVAGTNLGVGLPALNGFTTLVNFTGNILEKTAERGIPWPLGNTLVEPGQLATLLDTTTLKVKSGTAGY